MRILLNGEPREIAVGATVADLLRELDRDPRTVAVEHNGEILPRGRYPATRLAPDDRLEVVHFVQGGRGSTGGICVYNSPVRAASSIGRAADS